VLCYVERIHVNKWEQLKNSRWGRDFLPVQTGPGAHPASCKMGNGSSPGVRCGRGMLLTTQPLLEPRSWKSRAIPLPTLWATLGLKRDYFTFFISFICLFVSMYLWQDFRKDSKIQSRNAKFRNRQNEEPLRSVVCFISKALYKLDQWISRNFREIIVKNSVRYVTVYSNARIYLLLLYMFFHLSHVKLSVLYCEKKRITTQIVML
jgi:hypothetical protein